MGVPRILHLADTHIGADLPARPRSPRRRRGDDFVDSFRRALAPALTGAVDLVIHAGDLFDCPRPSNAAVAAAANPLLEIAAAGTPVVIVPGNHERCAIPATLLLAHPNIHIVREPATLRFSLRGLHTAVSAFPCIRRNAASGFTAALHATRWSNVATDVRILAAHQTFDSATCGPGNYRFRATADDNVVPRGTSLSPFHYVAAGHIHRHQVLLPTETDGPPIVYSGSPDRISFAEIGEPKGTVLVELSNGGARYTFQPHAVRPMVIVPLDVSGLSRAALEQRLDELLAALPADVVALLRLSGQASRALLRGWRLSERLRAARPDVHVSVSSQAIEHDVPRIVAARSASPFDLLDAPRRERIEATRDSVDQLPNVRGVYVLSGSDRRPLYVGKSATLRTRVRVHLRSGGPSAFFHGWTAQIANVAVRTAASELEALVIEAELVRRLRPPFNRQMRLWRRYCYLAATGAPHAQLRVLRDPPMSGACFGPFRSRRAAEEVADFAARRFGCALCPEDIAATSATAGALCQRYYQGVCAGPCAGRITPDEYAQRTTARAALLSGEPGAAAAGLEHELAELISQGLSDDGARQRRYALETLQTAQRQAVLFRAARSLFCSAILLPGSAGRRTMAGFTLDGAWLDEFSDAPADMARVLRCSARAAASAKSAVDAPLPKALVDCLCTVVRHSRQDRGQYRRIAADELRRLTPVELRMMAFGGKPESQPTPAFRA